MSPAAVGIDVGGTKCLGVALDGEGQVVGEYRVPTPDHPEALVAALADIADHLGAGDAVGVAVPGLVNRDGVLLAAANLKGTLRHRVRLSAGFWLAHTACTQALWAAVMGGKNPNRFRDDARNPVEKVSCDDVSAFLHRLVPLLPGVAADLPTEAEWEYASRAGSETRFHFGATITPQQANYNAKHPYDGWKKGKSRRKTVPVKSFAPNDWGLYEMHGNVWEWCADGLRDYAGEMVEDPRGAEVRAPPGRARWLVGQRGQGASLRISRHGAPRHVLRESPRPGVSLCPEVHPPATDFGCVLHCRGRRRCAALLLSIGAASIPPSPAHAVLPMRPAISSCCTRAWSERNS